MGCNVQPNQHRKAMDVTSESYISGLVVMHAHTHTRSKSNKETKGSQNSACIQPTTYAICSQSKITTIVMLAAPQTLPGCCNGKHCSTLRFISFVSWLLASLSAYSPMYGSIPNTFPCCVLCKAETQNGVPLFHAGFTIHKPTRRLQQDLCPPPLVLLWHHSPQLQQDSTNLMQT